MKLFLLPLIFIANFAFASIPQIDRIEGAHSYDLTDGIKIFASFSGLCNEYLSVCHTHGFQGPEILRLVFKDDVSQMRVANLQGLTIPIQKSVAEKAVEISWDTLCLNSQMADFCTQTGNFKRIAIRAFIDANSNGLMDSIESAVAIEFHLITPENTFYSQAGDMNSEGVQAFTPYPGDSSFYLENIMAGTGYPMLSYNSRAKKMRVYLSDQDMRQANALQATLIKDIPLNDDGTLAYNQVTGLTNGLTYAVRVALIDEAGNIVLNFPGYHSDPTCDAAPMTGCPWAVTPEAVSGR